MMRTKALNADLSSDFYLTARWSFYIMLSLSNFASYLTTDLQVVLCPSTSHHPWLEFSCWFSDFGLVTESEKASEIRKWSVDIDFLRWFMIVVHDALIDRLSYLDRVCETRKYNCVISSVIKNLLAEQQFFSHLEMTGRHELVNKSLAPPCLWQLINQPEYRLAFYDIPTSQWSVGKNIAVRKSH